MRSFSVILALLFAFVATSYAWPGATPYTLEARKGHNATKSGGGDSTKKACSQISRLTHLTELAANQTKIDELVAKGKMNATSVDALKTKAAAASTKLQTLTSNTTLTSECAVIDAAQKTSLECQKIKQLTKLANIASNQTAMDALVAKKSLNSTEVDGLKAMAQKAATKLQTLTSNTTLTDICAKKQESKGAASGTTSSSSGAASSSGTAAQVSASNGAGGLTVQSVPYVLVPALAGVFAFLL